MSRIKTMEVPMPRLAMSGLIVIGAGLASGCDRATGPAEQTGSISNANSDIRPLNSGATVTRGPVGFSLSVVDFERGLTAHVTSGPSVTENCGSGEFSEQTDLLQVIQPNGVERSRLIGRDLKIGVWLEPLANICSSPFAVGQGHATLVNKDLANVGKGTQILSWHVSGSVTALDGGQRYRIQITIHQAIHQNGTISGNRTVIRLIPLGH
jgi:hypothetical protein